MTSLVLTPLLVFFYLSLASANNYDVVNFGAKGNGQTDSTNAFLNAWAAACGSAQPASIYVPPGRYLLRKVEFIGSDCRNNQITIRIDGTLVAPSDYRVLGNADNWLLFEQVSGVSIYGGTLDGQGTGLWACKGSGYGCPKGATVWVERIQYLSYFFSQMTDFCCTPFVPEISVRPTKREPKNISLLKENFQVFL